MNDLLSSKVRLLLVDDSPLVIRALEGLLALIPDVEVVAIAYNGEEAIERSLQVEPDLVLMDIQMPVMNGIEAAKAIVQQQPKVKILFFPSLCTNEQFVESQQVQGSRFLLKGGSLDQLQSEIHSLVA